MVQLYENQINEHFAEEKKLRGRIAQIEQNIASIENQMKKEGRTDDSNLIRIQNLTKQRQDLQPSA